METASIPPTSTNGQDGRAAAARLPHPGDGAEPSALAVRAAGARPRVIIIGGGFGGLTAARALGRAAVEVVLIDRSNHHLFQPLLYQVAMAGLSAPEIATPIRSILRRQENTTVLLGEVTGIDLAARNVTVSGEKTRVFAYDYLIIAAGARTHYFGHDEWKKYALGLKDVDEAVEIRRQVLVAFEAAEFELDPERRRELLTFAIIGGGPTGVELAGALSELARHVLARDFKRIDPSSTRVLLLEAGTRVLPAMDETLSQRALEDLRFRLGVEVRLRARVTGIDAQGIHLGDETIRASTIIWAAGVRAAPLAEKLGVELDRGGRIIVKEDCSIPGHPEAFAIGDIALFLDASGHALPGVSPVAMQQARFVAEVIQRSLEGQPRRAFEYFDKGSMATIGRSRAVAQVGRLRLDGFIAWLAWLAVHIWYLIGFRNRVIVMLEWFWAYVLYRRGARLITGHVLMPRALAPRTEAAGPEPPPSPILVG